MQRSRISRIIAFLALLTVALALASLSVGDPIVGDGGSIIVEDEGGALIIDVRREVHFGW